MITDHESLKTINNKSEQPARIVRFFDAIEHYGIRMIYRPGKANVLADYLSRPEINSSSFPAFVDEEEGDGLLPIHRNVNHPNELNQLDLQAIFEYLQLNAPLPRNLTAEWVKKNFTVYDDLLHKITQYKRVLGDPPNAGGTLPNTTTMVSVRERQTNLRKG